MTRDKTANIHDDGENVPNPGSPEAVKAGCLCPVLDNHQGLGVPDGENGRIFWMIVNCPLHGNAEV